jgi:hypothetical protein
MSYLRTGQFHANPRKLRNCLSGTAGLRLHRQSGRGCRASPCRACSTCCTACGLQGEADRQRDRRPLWSERFAHLIESRVTWTAGVPCRHQAGTTGPWEDGAVRKLSRGRDLKLSDSGAVRSVAERSELVVAASYHHPHRPRDYPSPGRLAADRPTYHPRRRAEVLTP